MKTTRILLSLVAATALAGTTTTAYANPTTKTPTTPGLTTTMLTGDAIHKLTPTEINTNPDAQRRITDYLTKTSTKSRKLTTDDVAVYAVDKAAAGGANIMAITTKDDTLNGVMIERSTTRKNDDDTQRVGAQFLDVAPPSIKKTRDAAKESINAINAGRNCRSVYHDPNDSWPEDNIMYDCWEKFFADGNNKAWTYNRYTTFTPARGRFGLQANMIDPTIMFRPYKGRMNVRMGPYHYAPNPKADCKPLDITVGVGKSTGSSVKIPMVHCDAYTRLRANTSEHRMGIAWEVVAQEQNRIDAVGSFDTSSPSLTMSDYMGFVHTSCPAGPWSCQRAAAGTVFSKYPFSWTDGGWN